MQVTSGTRLGFYEIVSPVGAGGMGEVWRARDSRVGRDVALKVLPIGVASDADRLKRFEQEARAAGSLNHPNLVTLFELGTHEGTPFIVMELLDGETLRQKLDEGALPSRKALDYAVQMAHGLAAAHDKGVVHRDLKPENVFITRDGRLKILDFGLAKLQAPQETGLADATLAKAGGTAPGTVMGTVGYMSPEQVRGQEVDHRSDIFSFGAIVYEMLTGRRAFQGPSSVETMNAILREDPPEVESASARVPPAADRLVRRCLEKSRDERFHSAHDVAYALEVISTASGSSSQPAIASIPRRRLMPVAIAAACLAFGALGFGVARLMRTPEERPVLPHFTQLTFEGGLERDPSISPDGKSFAYASKRSGNFDIYVQRIGGTNTLNVTPASPDHDTRPVFSPDGQLIAFRSSRDGGGLFVMGATGESVRRLTDFGFDPAWSPDGKRIAFATEGIVNPYTRGTISALWIVDVLAGTTQKVEGTGDAVQPAWSPDGTRIAYWTIDKGRRVIQSIPVRGGNPTAIMTEAALSWNPVWSPDGKALLFASDRSGVMSLWRVAIDQGSGETRGQPQPLTAPSERDGFLSVAQDGTALFQRSRGGGHLYEIPFDPANMTLAGPPRDALRGTRTLRSADLSSDGEWLTFAAGLAQEDIFVARRDGSELRQVTNDAARDRMPRWSPDGSRIAFYSTRGGEYDLWMIRPDGGDARQLTRGLHAFDPAWSPDGQSIAVATQRGDALLVSATGPPSVRILPIKQRFYPTSWTADGARICGTLAERSPEASDFAGAAVYHLGTTQIEPVSDFKGWAVCVGNDAMLIFGGRGTRLDHESRLKVLDLRTRELRDLGDFGLQGRSATIARDGKSIFAPSVDDEADVWMMKFVERPREP